MPSLTVQRWPLSELSPDLAKRLGNRLRTESMQDARVKVSEVYVVSGQLAAVFSLNFPDSLPDDRKIKMTEIAQQECVSYLQSPHISKGTMNP